MPAMTMLGQESLLPGVSDLALGGIVGLLVFYALYYVRPSVPSTVQTNTYSSPRQPISPTLKAFPKSPVLYLSPDICSRSAKTMPQSAKAGGANTSKVSSKSA